MLIFQRRRADGQPLVACALAKRDKKPSTHMRPTENATITPTRVEPGCPCNQSVSVVAAGPAADGTATAPAGVRKGEAKAVLPRLLAAGHARRLRRDVVVQVLKNQRISIDSIFAALLSNNRVPAPFRTFNWVKPSGIPSWAKVCARRPSHPVRQLTFPFLVLASISAVVAADKIEGAFGLKFGEVFEPTTHRADCITFRQAPSIITTPTSLLRGRRIQRFRTTPCSSHPIHT